MCKKLFLFVSVLLLIGTPAFATVGVFDYQEDFGYKGIWPGGKGYHGLGSTVLLGPEVGEDYEGKYVMTAGGDDIEDKKDKGGHIAYNLLSGDFRVTTTFDRWLAVHDSWAKYGVMVRTSGDADSANAFSMSKRNGDLTQLQHRLGTGQNTNDTNRITGQPKQMWNLGIQAFRFGPLVYVEGLREVAGTWELNGTAIFAGPQELMAGPSMTSHKDDEGWDPQKDPWLYDRSHLAQIMFSNVEYSANPEMLGEGFPEYPEIPYDPDYDDCREWDPGFRIRVMSCGPGTNMDGPDDQAGYDKAADLLADGILDGVPTDEYGARTDQVVNLHDKGGRFNFDNDSSYPGVDAFGQPTDDPHDGDDDDHFAIEVLACVELTAGAHVFGAHMDDGVKVLVGGVEIGRTSKWNSTDMFPFIVTVAGKYSFYALGFERGGGGDLELLEMIADGSWVLLGEGPTAVYVPEPATIALLGFGGLALLRIRKKR